MFLKTIALLILMTVPAWSATELKRYVVGGSTPGGDGTTTATTGDNRGYASLEECMNANEKNLVTADQYFNVEITGTWSSADTSTVTIHNYTTDATRYINIYTTGDARHDGTAWKTGGYVLAPSSSYAINIATFNYSILDGVVINMGGSTTSAINQAGDLTSYVYKDIIVHNGTSITSTLLIRAGSTGKIINPIIFNVKRGIYCASDTVDTTIYNATIKAGASSSYGILNIKTLNSFVAGFGTEDFYSLPASGSDYNVSSDNSADDEAANYALGKTDYSAYFTNVTSGAEDFHLKATSNTLWGLSGTDLSATFTTDIDGDTRTGTWDIGADEYVATSTGNPVSTVWIFDGMGMENMGIN